MCILPGFPNTALHDVSDASPLANKEALSGSDSQDKATFPTNYPQQNPEPVAYINMSVII